MRKIFIYSTFFAMCGTFGLGCASTTSGTTAADNTANLDAVLQSSITQKYLQAAAANPGCAVDANVVVQIIDTLGAALHVSVDANVDVGVNVGVEQHLGQRNDRVWNHNGKRIEPGNHHGWRGDGAQYRVGHQPEC